MAGSFAAFCAVVVLVVVTPGQDTALTIRNALAGGRRAGVFSALGIVTGQATWTAATAAGLAALLVASAAAFFVLRLVGAGYLVYLGLRALWSAFRASPKASSSTAETRCVLSARAAYRQGLASNLGNAKIAAFFTSVVPQFASPHATFLDFAALGLVLCACTLAWLALYACLVARTADVLRRPRVRRWLESVTGATLVALGVRIAVERP